MNNPVCNKVGDTVEGLPTLLAFKCFLTCMEEQLDRQADRGDSVAAGGGGSGDGGCDGGCGGGGGSDSLTVQRRVMRPTSGCQGTEA